MRHVALLFLLCACSTLTTEQRDQLASCQRNAGLYFEGGRLDQAMGQVERGLDIDPSDYKLNVLRGSILLRISNSASGTDHKRLDEATAILAKVYEERSPARHEPYLLTNYALALQKQGMRHLSEAARSEGQATRVVPAEVQPLLDAAKVEREQATVLLKQAFDMLGVLVDRGEVLRLAHNHRTQIARDLQDDATFLSEAKAYLEQAAKDEAVLEKRVKDTTVAAYEAEQAEVLRNVKAEELGMRDLLALFYYRQQKYEEVVAQLNRVLEIDPQRTEDYYNRGRALLELKRLDEAKSDFRRFLVDPSLPSTNEKVVFAAQVLDR